MRRVESVDSIDSVDSVDSIDSIGEKVANDDGDGSYRTKQSELWLIKRKKEIMRIMQDYYLFK